MRETYETDFDYEGYRISKRQSEDKNLRVDSSDKNEAMTEKERKEAKKARKKNRKKNKLKNELENLANQNDPNHSSTPEKATESEVCKNQKLTPDKENNNFNSNNTPPVHSGIYHNELLGLLIMNCIYSLKERRSVDSIKK